MGKTTYQKAWEEKWSWLTSVKNDPYSGYCKLYYKTFKIDGRGASQVKEHESSILHTSRNKTNQMHLLMIEVLCQSVKIKK